jgi:bifunctional aspartokinase / homoserine dehydrogenase 1
MRNIIAIAQGSSETNISFVVASRDMKKALLALHQEFALDTRNLHETSSASQ